MKNNNPLTSFHSLFIVGTKNNGFQEANYTVTLLHKSNNNHLESLILRRKASGSTKVCIIFVIYQNLWKLSCLLCCALFLV